MLVYYFAAVFQLSLMETNDIQVSLAQMSVRNCFIRGSVVRYVQLPPGSVDTEILHDATRREARG